MSVASYLEDISKDYARGIATEHTFRPALKTLIEELVPDVTATNEPKRIDCGAPDYVITRKDIPVGYIEAKDVATDLGAKSLKEQFDRYRDALDNLVFTDYLIFSFYVNGQHTASIQIAYVEDGQVVPVAANFDEFTSLIKEFCSRRPQTIKGSKRLAEMMAEKAKILEAYVSLITGLGAAYNPGNGDIVLAKFTTRLTEVQPAWDAYGGSKASRKMAETGRENLYEVAEDTLMASINYYASTSAPANRVEDVREIMRKWRGVRAGEKPQDDPNTPENEAENTNSSAQTGYVQRAEHFDSALDIYTADSTYSPNEDGLKVTPGLNDTSDALHASNTAVIAAISDWSTKRGTFFNLMYTGPNHALEMVRLSKGYLKATLGADNLTYKQAVALKFRYPKL